MIDSISWGHNLRKSNTPCLCNFDVFVGQIQNMYSNHHKRLNMVRRWYDDFPQGYYNANENLWTYTNRLRRNWRDADWDQEQYEPILYEMVWAGFEADLLPTLIPWSKGSGKFDSIDECLHQAADVETEPSKYNMWQQKPPGESSHVGGRLHNFHSPISKYNAVPRNASKPYKSDDSSSGGGTDLPQSRWVTREVYALGKANRKCLQCCNHYKSFQCPECSNSHCQDWLTPGDGTGKDRDDTGGNQQSKHQWSIDTQQVKMWYTSPGVQRSRGCWMRLSWEWRNWGCRHWWWTWTKFNHSRSH